MERMSGERWRGRGGRQTGWQVGRQDGRQAGRQGWMDGRNGSGEEVEMGRDTERKVER